MPPDGHFVSKLLLIHRRLHESTICRATQGGDLGAGVATALFLRHAERILVSLFSRAAKVCVAKAEWILQAVAQEAVEAHMRQSDKPHCKRD